MAEKNHFWGSLILVILSITLSLLLAEAIIRIFLPQPLSGTWRVNSEKGYMLNKSGGTARHQKGSRVVQYRFNELHLRGGAIQANIPEILVVGDSYTFGWLLAEKETYVHHLQNYIDRELGKATFQVLNGGAGGWGTADYLAFIEEFGEEINPEAIVVFLNTDDIGRSIKQGIYKLEDATSLELSVRQGIQNNAGMKKFMNSFPFYQWFLEHSHLVQFFRHLAIQSLANTHHRNIGSIPIAASPDLQTKQTDAVNLGHALFHRLKQWCDKHEVRLFVLTTGWHFRNAQEKQEKYIGPTRAFMRKAEEIFLKEDIPFYDMTFEVLLTINGRLEDFVIPNDGHPNEKGSKLIANKAWLWLKSHLAEMLQTKK